MRPERFELAYLEKKVTTFDGYELNSWIIKGIGSNPSDVLFVVVNSDAGNMGYVLPYAAGLAKKGFPVVTFDYRGFGESSDFKHNPNNFYHDEYITDFKSILSWVRTEMCPRKIAILSFSMGTLIATSTYEDNAFDYFVGEGFISSPTEVVQRIKETKGKNLTLPEDSEDYQDQLDKMKVPILLFGNRYDQITPLEESQDFASKLPNRKVIEYEFEGDRLRGAQTLGLDQYIGQIYEFIEHNN